MKISLVLNPRRPLDRSEAWGCVTANLALPGSGSLLAGRPIGYAQVTCAFTGLILTLVSGMRFVVWFFGNWAHLQDQSMDPLAYLQEVWTAVQWPLCGMAIFVFSVLWALVTSFHILSTTTKRPVLPPRLP